MITYKEYNKKTTDRVNNFPMHFAFSNKQLKESLDKMGITDYDLDKPETLKGKVSSISGGGFIKYSDKEEYIKMMNEIHDELNKCLADDKFLYEALVYELGNHEYVVTYDPSDALDVFGLNEETLTEREREILKKAIETTKSNCGY